MKREQIKQFFTIFPAANRDQLARLFFSDNSDPTGKCTKYMRQFRKEKWVDANTQLKGPYVYFARPLRIHKHSHKLKHWLSLVDLYIELKESGIPFDILALEHSFGRGLPQPDMILSINGTCYMVEVQRTEDRRMKKKIEQYHSLYIDSGHETFCDAFTILIITEKFYEIDSQLPLIQTTLNQLSSSL